MPKKKEEAREREDQKKQDARKKAQEEKEAAKWTETDKNVVAKLERKKQEEEKKEAAAKRKEEARRLQEEETKAWDTGKGSGYAPEKKLTAHEAREQQKELLVKSLQKAYDTGKTDTAPEGAEKVDDDYIAPNQNHIRREDAESFHVDAQNVGDALDQLGGGDLEKHPERRMKAAWNAYIEQQMPQLKAEFPSLKRSQLMHMMVKNWKKAPENPMNQDHKEYNEK